MDDSERYQRHLAKERAHGESRGRGFLIGLLISIPIDVLIVLLVTYACGGAR